MYIKKAYQDIIDKYEHDEDGWWAYMVPGIYFEYEGLHTIHEDTQKDLLRVLYTYPKGRCHCDDCEREMERWGLTDHDVESRLAGIGK